MKPGFMIPLIFGAAVSVVLCGCGDDDCGYKPTCVDNVPPAIPAGVYSVTGDQQVTIFWNPVLGSDVRGYGVWWSDDLPGPYERMADVMDEESYYYVDTDVDNARTYFYAVTAFDFNGNESDLSIESVFDTPRPAGFDVRVYDVENSPSEGGLDFFQAEIPGYQDDDLVVAWDASGTDLYLDSASDNDPDVLRFVPVGGTLIQDFGFTESLDEIDWAPIEGWSDSPMGVEVIRGHSYIVQTVDDNYAKLRVSVINRSRGYVILDWAYQLVPDNQELMPPAPDAPARTIGIVEMEGRRCQENQESMEQNGCLARLKK
ncbi:MAG: hypothetical protein KAW17_06280 [Candidatus Eisenbacteria sp.]|nr:hypothetical protein [Candidatus Eisenbacteria bacterium]